MAKARAPAKQSGELRGRTPKQRMLAAYRGLPLDRPPVAPEFWYYYPARVLGVDMVAFEREVPLWEALLATFRRCGCAGWGAVFPTETDPDRRVETSFAEVEEGVFRETQTCTWREASFTTRRLYSLEEPSWIEAYPVEREEDLDAYLEMRLSDRISWDTAAASEAHARVGEAYLLEVWLGCPFFDLISDAMGFEKAVYYFTACAPERLEAWRDRYIAFTERLVDRVCRDAVFESLVIGCSSSCNSLIGPQMWRRWDKPYIRAVCERVHANDRLLHVHFHGKSMETAADFAELGIDSVCPFERPPGGDVDGYEGLVRLRELLEDKVTMNGNVHTVETLIRGTPTDVRRQVREIKRAFAGSHRLIIGTGDQVGRETPEENVLAMIEEGQRRS